MLMLGLIDQSDVATSKNNKMALLPFLKCKGSQVSMVTMLFMPLDVFTQNKYPHNCMK